MPIAFTAGSTPKTTYELQKDIEDFAVEASAQLDQQHGPNGEHTDITADSIGSHAGGGSPLSLSSGLRMLYGPWLIDRDNVPTDNLTAVVRVDDLSSNQNDFNPAGLSHAVVLELSASSAIHITGLEAGTAQTRRLLLIVNRGGDTITLDYNSSSSLSRNRFGFPGGASYELLSGDVLWLYNDPGAPGWRGAGGAMSQVRYAFVQALVWSSGGAATQNFTFVTTLTDYTKAHCMPMIAGSPGAAMQCAAFATSNTNLRVVGLPTGSGDIDVVVNVIEYRNIG